MADPWTTAWAEAVASVPADDVQVATLDFQHAGFIEDGSPVAVRVANTVAEFAATLEDTAPLNAGEVVTFLPVPFVFVPPSFEEGRGIEASIIVDNLNGEVSQYLETAETLLSPLLVIFRLYLTSDPAQVAWGPFSFVMRQVKIKGATFTGTITVGNPQLLKFLRMTYRPDLFPAINRA